MPENKIPRTHGAQLQANSSVESIILFFFFLLLLLLLSYGTNRVLYEQMQYKFMCPCYITRIMYSIYIYKCTEWYTYVQDARDVYNAMWQSTFPCVFFTQSVQWRDDGKNAKLLVYCLYFGVQRLFIHIYTYTSWSCYYTRSHGQMSASVGEPCVT